MKKRECVTYVPAAFDARAARAEAEVPEPWNSLIPTLTES